MPDGLPADAAVPIAILNVRYVVPGREVVVEGYVPVAPGTFASSAGEQGGAIQDHTDGVYVSTWQKLELELPTGRA